MAVLITPLKPRPERNTPWVTPDGHPSEALASFIQSAESLLKLLNGTGGMTLTNAANDGAAAAANVAVGGLYRNGSVVMIRVA